MYVNNEDVKIINITILHAGCYAYLLVLCKPVLLIILVSAHISGKYY
jgi:hypothetical protein